MCNSKDRFQQFLADASGLVLIRDKLPNELELIDRKCLDNSRDTLWASAFLADLGKRFNCN